jgi:hypothetical protein
MDVGGEALDIQKNKGAKDRFGQAAASVIIGFAAPLVLIAGILTQSVLAIVSGPISLCGFILGIMARRSRSVRFAANAGMFLNATLLACYVFIVVMYFVTRNASPL